VETAWNHALIVGELVTEPEWRKLRGGADLFSFALTVRREDAATTSVPLVWYDPPQRVRRWKVGACIVASGSVVRRFYRAGGVTASRTEVTVERAERRDQTAKSRRVIDRSIDELGAALATGEAGTA